MSLLPALHYGRAEALRLRRQPVAWLALAALALALAGASLSAGLQAREWRQAALQDEASHRAALAAAGEPFCTAGAAAAAGPSRAVATYQLGRGALGATRMAMGPGLALDIPALQRLPHRLTASLDSRHATGRDPGPLRNPLLGDAGLPALPAVAALLLPLVALVLCAGLLQEEREQGRLGLLRVHAAHGMGAWLLAALGLRLAVLWLVAAAATLPALLLDPGADARTLLAWLLALGGFTAFWVGLGGLLSCLRISSGTALLLSLGLWLALSFALPAALLAHARQHAPLPSRLAAIVEIREAQRHAEDQEQALAGAWYARHPHIAPQLPARWPASFVARTLQQDEALQAPARRFADARARQAARLGRAAWLSPGLALVLHGQRLAGTDVASHLRYGRQVDAFEERWRQTLVPAVMDGKGIDCTGLDGLPRFDGRADVPAGED